jgi:hypothetical protein
MGITGKWKLWNAEDDARLTELCINLPSHASRSAGWEAICESFLGRTPLACRQRWLYLRRIILGIMPKKRPPRDRKPNGKVSTKIEERYGMQTAAPSVRYARPFAELLGEPPIGRSALDQKLQQQNGSTAP